MQIDPSLDGGLSTDLQIDPGIDLGPGGDLQIGPGIGFDLPTDLQIGPGIGFDLPTDLQIAPGRVDDLFVRFFLGQKLTKLTGRQAHRPVGVALAALLAVVANLIGVVAIELGVPHQVAGEVAVAVARAQEGNLGKLRRAFADGGSGCTKCAAMVGA